MTFKKKGGFSLAINILVLIMVVFLIWGIVSGKTNKAFASVMNPIKKLMGLEDKEDLEKKKEAERVEKELFEKAGKVYENFANIMDNCVNKNKNDRSCTCGTIDFSELNQYNLELATDGTNQILTLRDKNKVPVKDKSKTLGKFSIGPIDITTNPSNIGKDIDYSRPSVVENRIKSFSKGNILFTNEQIEFDQIIKSKEKTNEIYFTKVTEDTIAIDERDYWGRTCGQKVDCIKNYVIYTPSLSESEQRQGSLPNNNFKICKKNIDPNVCFENNDQFIQKSDKCEEDKISTEVLGCSINFNIEDSSVDNKKLKDNFIIDARGVSSQIKFKYIYNFKDIIGNNKFEEINKLASQIKTKGKLFDIDEDINIRVFITDKIKPFESVNTKISIFINQVYKKLIGKGMLIIIATEDKKIEIIFDKDVGKKVGINDQNCENILSNFNEGKSYSGGLENIMENIKNLENTQDKIVKEQTIKFAQAFKNIKNGCYINFNEKNFENLGLDNEVILEIISGESSDMANFYYKDSVGYKKLEGFQDTGFKYCDIIKSLNSKKLLPKSFVSDQKVILSIITIFKKSIFFSKYLSYLQFYVAKKDTFDGPIQEFPKTAPYSNGVYIFKNDNIKCIFSHPSSLISKDELKLCEI